MNTKQLNAGRDQTWCYLCQKLRDLADGGGGLRMMAAILVALIMVVPARVMLSQVAGEGSIQGRITDPSGAVVPNATVTAQETSTGVSTARTSTRAGVYTISPLPIGRYTVTTVAPGFATAVQENIQVNATQSVGLDFKLTIGTQKEVVTVTTAPPALQTTDATLGGVMENSTYEQLPLILNNGPLDPTAFVTLMAGVAPVGRSGVLNGAGGSAAQADEIYMDGVPLTESNAQGDNRAVQLGVSLDSVNQFQVVTSSASVQYGGLGATNFNIKSGTNLYHGDAYVAFRNTAFDAWSYFAKAATTSKLVNGVLTTVPAPKPAEHQDEETVTLGGPVRIPHLYDGRNKLFFFISYARYHETTGINPTLQSVPTSLERAGNFTQLSNGAKIYDPTTTSATCLTKPSTCSNLQFMGILNGVPTPNVIPQSEISPQAQYLQKFLPLPQNDNATQNNVLTGLPLGISDWTLNERVDYQLSSRQRMSAVGSGGSRVFSPCDGCGPLPIPYSNGNAITEKVYTGIVEHDFTISSRVVNNFRYAYNRFWDIAGSLTQGISQYEAGPGVGIGNLPPGQASESFPLVLFNGFADVPSLWRDSSANISASNTYDVVDNVLWSHGNHNTTFGFVFQWLNSNVASQLTATAPLSLNFSNVNTAGYNASGNVQNTNSGNPYASFMVGAVNSTSATIFPFSTLGARYKAFSPYLQDDWRVTPKLTVNLGLRWDIFTPFTEVQNRVSFLNRSLTNPAKGTLGAMQFAGPGSNGCNCSTPVNTYYGNVGPRIGLAYSVDRKTVVRAGFGIQYTHTGGVGGRGGATNGTGQVGLTASTSFPSSGQSGAIPAFYLNSSTDFQKKGIANTSLPSYSAGPFVNPIVNAGNYINTGANPNVPVGAAVTAQSVSYADPYYGGRGGEAENYNFGVQRAITNNLTLTVDYAGSESHFLAGGSRGNIINQLNPQYENLGAILKQLPGSVDAKTGQTYLQEANAIDPGITYPYSNFGGPQATVQAMLLPLPQYGGISDTFGAVGNASYNSLQVTVTERPVSGVSFSLNYTYSKEFDNTGSYRSGYAIPGYVMTDGIPRAYGQLDRSLGTGDIPQLFHAYGVWDTHFGRGENWLVRGLVGGWSISGIFTYNSGSPLAITSSGCQVIGQGTCMPSYTVGYGGSPRINGGWGKSITAATAGTHPYIDAAAFTVPNQTYQIGNVPRTGAYHLFGPGGFDLDGGVSRSFEMTHELAFVLNASAVNVTNAVHFGISNTTVTPAAVVPGVNSLGTNVKSNFSTIGRQTNAARDWQFSGKFNF